MAAGGRDGGGRLVARVGGSTRTCTLPFAVWHANRM